MDDIDKTNDNMVIYKYQPQSNEKEIYISFLGHCNERAFEFYLYSALSDINLDEEKSFINYINKFINFGELKLNHELEVYYILVKMNSFEYEYKYLSFMIYNLKENMNIGKYDDYMLACEGSRNFILNYPVKNITKYLTIETRGYCYNIIIMFYNNNDIKPELIYNITQRCYNVQYLNLTFIENNNYYINISVNSTNNRIVRLLFYLLDNDKDILEVKNNKSVLKYSYVSFISSSLYGVTNRAFFINIENITINELISYNIYEPFNQIKYRYSYKFYKDYNFSLLQKKDDIRNFDYKLTSYQNLEENPMIFIRKNFDAKGLLLIIKSRILEDNEDKLYNELIVYLYPKSLFNLTQNERLNYDKLITNNAFNLYKIKDDLLMKSNLDYFTMLYPKRQVIKSKSYFLDSRQKQYIFEIQISEKALVELKFINNSEIISLENADFMYLCKDNIEEEKYIYLPYMTNFNILLEKLKFMK